jgi:hypothetical protein
MLACVPKGSRSAAEVEHRDGGDLREQVWLDGAAAGYVVRLDIAGFSKDEVDVRVNGATGRVTVLGQRPAAAAAAGPHVRLRRVIQLPPTADSDRVAARFVGTTLFLTVPKKRPAAATGVVMATTIEVAETETEKKKERAARWDSGSVVAAAAAAAAFALGVVVSHGILLYTRNG